MQKKSKDEDQTRILCKLPSSTASVEVPSKTIDQVIGQDRTVEIVKKAANQRRHILLIGEPGTGKSLLGRGMAELMPKEQLEDIVVFPNENDENTPVVKTFKVGDGKVIVDSALRDLKAAEKFRQTVFMALFMGVTIITIYYFIALQQPIVLFGGITASVFLLIGMNYTKHARNLVKIPKLLVTHTKGSTPPFIDGTGAYAGSLLGDVRHDPFQAGGLETPAHERVEVGAIHRSHKGVLFIDEVATLSRRTQIELLTAMQEKKYAITGKSERSAGSMVKTQPVPCDFVLIAAGNLPTVARMNPALRSRIRGYGYEIFMNESMPDTPENEEALVRFIAQEVVKDKKIPHFDAGAIAQIIVEARKRSGRKGHLTLKLRELGGLIRAAGDAARSEATKVVTATHIFKAMGIARTVEQQIADDFIAKKKDYSVIVSEGQIVGRVNGLAVVGEGNSGIVLPLEAEVTPGGERSEIVATGRLGKIAKEAIQNVSAVIMKLYGQSIKESSDIYVQFLQTYEGVEGDSASVAVATAIISAYKKIPVDQSVGMTGSLSVRGEVLPVGGVTAKIEAAIVGGLKTVIIPAANLNDVMLNEEQKKKIRIIPVKRIEEVLKHSLVGKKGILEKLSPLTRFARPQVA